MSSWMPEDNHDTMSFELQEHDKYIVDALYDTKNKHAPSNMMKWYINCGEQLTESGGCYVRQKNEMFMVWDDSAVRGHASFRDADRQLDECDG